jgi:hypothetical protein
LPLTIMDRRRPRLRSMLSRACNLLLSLGSKVESVVHGVEQAFRPAARLIEKPALAAEAPESVLIT